MRNISVEARERIREGAKKSVLLQRKRRENKYQENPTRCKYCNNKIPYKKRENKYCNSHCAAKENNKHKIKKYYCQYCNGEITSKRKNKRKFCSNECFQNNKRQLRERKIEETGIINYHPTITRKYLIRKRGHCCEICKIQIWGRQKTPLVLDHINGNPYDNHLVNLRMICPNCDAQLPTYKGLNKGNGRHSRMKRYYSGQSY